MGWRHIEQDNLTSEMKENVKQLTIRPLKIYRDNLNGQGKRSEADKVQIAIEMLQARNKCVEASMLENAKVWEVKAIQHLRDHKIPYGAHSVKGERTSWVNDGGKLPGRRAHVCQNWKGYMPDKFNNPRPGFKWDRYEIKENGKQERVGVRQ